MIWLADIFVHVAFIGLMPSLRRVLRRTLKSVLYVWIARRPLYCRVHMRTVSSASTNG